MGKDPNPVSPASLLKVEVWTQICTQEYHQMKTGLMMPQAKELPKGGSSGKEPPHQCRRRKRHRFDPWVRNIPEEDTAAHSSILAWRIPWTEEPSGLQPIGSQRVRHD